LISSQTSDLKRTL